MAFEKKKTSIKNTGYTKTGTSRSTGEKTTTSGSLKRVTEDEFFGSKSRSATRISRNGRKLERR